MPSARTIAERARKRIGKMIVEQTRHTGKRPTVIRVKMGDYLALKEVNYVRDNDELSGVVPVVSILPG